MISLPEEIKNKIWKAIQFRYRSKKAKKSPCSTRGMGFEYYTIKGIDQIQIEREILAGRFKVKKVVVELDNKTTDGKSLVFHLEEFNNIYKDGYHSDEKINYLKESES